MSAVFFTVAKTAKMSQDMAKVAGLFLAVADFVYFA